MRVIEQAAWRAQPWKNGRGTTNEIWRLPETGGDDDYDLRVSVAELTESGPFSRFPGYRRWSFLVGTAPVDLTYDLRASSEPAVSLVAPGEHIELPGDLAITAHLRAGPTHLLNVLARVRTGSGAASRSAAPSCVAGHGPVGYPVRFVFALAPRPPITARPDLAPLPDFTQPSSLARWDSIVLDPPAVIDTTACVWIA